MDDIYKQWLDTCLSAGIPAISTDTAARLLAVTYLCSNNENFVYNGKLLADLDYICHRWHIGGAETPDAEMVELVRDYSQEIEQAMRTKKDDPTSKAVFKANYPDWADELINSRYGFHLFQ